MNAYDVECFPVVMHCPALFVQHLVDLFGQFYTLMRHLLPRLLLLLRGFISRSHASLASVGVAAYARLVSSCGKQLDADGWTEVSRAGCARGCHCAGRGRKWVELGELAVDMCPRTYEVLPQMAGCTRVDPGEQG
jgi:hypothetical protein